MMNKGLFQRDSLAIEIKTRQTVEKARRRRLMMMILWLTGWLAD
jgi:hypothetical protein